ncbi:MAG: hypothetical protein ABIG95_03995 [Candidatus Woesearchaeota archaeon]
MDSRDIILGIIGFAISFYGGIKDDLLATVSGILIIILTVYLKLSEQEEDIKILNAQINTKNELNNIWREINDLKSKKFKKR